MPRHPSLPSLVREHREIEAALELLAASVEAGAIDLDAFHCAHRLCLGHYQHEEPFLARLSPALAAKLRAQHDEALELAVALEVSAAAGQTSDMIYLARRFLAIAQHNMIEEERDVFPLAE